MRNNRNLLLLLLTSLFTVGSLFSGEQQIPVAFKGRIRPLDSYARLWFFDLYQAQAIKKEDLTAFHLKSGKASDFIWQLHFHGHTPWDDAPLFSIHLAEVKKALGLDPKISRYSYKTLQDILNTNREANMNVLRPLIIHTFLNNQSRFDKKELTSLAPGLWVGFKGDQIQILAAPKFAPWHFLTPGLVIRENGRQLKTHADQKIAEEVIRLLSAMHHFSLEGEKPSEDLQQPLILRLESAGDMLKALPGRYSSGEWFSLKALKIEDAGNFTAYSDAQFQAIRTAYLNLEAATLHRPEEFLEKKEKLETLLISSYQSLASTVYKEANGKVLYYPSLTQLKLESAYYRYPLIEIAILFYLAGTVSLILGIKRVGLSLMLIGFALHTAVLLLRWTILSRPPVSNMFETVVYVPWIAILSGFVLERILRQNVILVASGIASIILLVLLKVTQLDSSMENVQAVLDSQYWLIIHVLMIVGSYGVFVLNGVLGHLYLIRVSRDGKETEKSHAIGRLILQTMYIGLILLIPGTILGGVWAAESWGRFWDWDPKESWAFISACVYLLWVHAFHFRQIHYFGLAVGSVAGLLAISFTWYGVNYILGTGFHSYGFGSGGELYYYEYLVAEIVFLCWAAYRHYNRRLA